MVPVYTFYFLLEKRGISSRWTNYLPLADSRFKNELVFVLNSINNYLITFFRGQVLVAMTDGALYGLGFLIIGLPYAVLIGVMAAFLTMIPYFGAIVTCFTALVIALVQFGDWQHPILVLVVFGVVQTLEALFISPKIMGGRVGLHPVTIIIAVDGRHDLARGLAGRHPGHSPDRRAPRRDVPLRLEKAGTGGMKREGTRACAFPSRFTFHVSRITLHEQIPHIHRLHARGANRPHP